MRGIEIRHLRYFQRVADKLHFGRAAETLGVSQAPLSQQIRQLEERIGVRLFDRNTRNVRLTPAGRVFAEKVDMIMNVFGDAIDDARMAGGLGLRLIHTIEMAPETVRRCKEKRDGRCFSSSERFDAADHSRFGVLKDVGHRPGYCVAKDLKMLNISCAFAPRIQADGRTPFRPYE